MFKTFPWDPQVLVKLIKLKVLSMGDFLMEGGEEKYFGFAMTQRKTG